MVEKSDIFADDYWKEQWKTVIAKEKTVDGDDVSVLGMSVQLARRWGPKFCPECEQKARKLLDLVDAAYKILSARREQMLGEKKEAARRRVAPAAPPGANGGSAGDASSLKVLEVLEDIRDGLIDLSRNNGHH
jgi:hypothetical protein